MTRPDSAYLETGGERLSICCALPWVARLIQEAASGELQTACQDDQASLHLSIECGRGPFDVRGWEVLTRGAWSCGSEVVLEDVCATGFDVLIRCGGSRAEFTYRWRPRPATHGLRLLLNPRFVLLTRAVILQYPVLWWASTRGRVPLHACAYRAGGCAPLVAGGSGVGKSTLLQREVAAGAVAAGDNLCISDGTTAWGIVEPMRLDSARGRAMTYGRREQPVPSRVQAIEPNCLVVLRRQQGQSAGLSFVSREMAASWLAAGTYMAGELRRYWAFAATLSAGLGVGPVHPAIGDVAMRLASRLPCVQVDLTWPPRETLSELLQRAALAA